MIVADTSALVSLATVDVLTTVLDEFDVHTTEPVVEELSDTADYDDTAAQAAQHTLQQRDSITVHATDQPNFESSRIDRDEASCIALTQELKTDFLITDDLRALPELQTLVAAQVAISPIVLKALVKRGVLMTEDAELLLEEMAESRDWLEAPIYRRARHLFE